METELNHIPTDQERIQNYKAIQAMHPGNRFRLMFGMPLLPEPKQAKTMSTYRNTCADCGDTYETESWEPAKCPFCEVRRLESELSAALDALHLMANQYIAIGDLPDGRPKCDHMHMCAGEDALDVLEFHGRVGADQSHY